MHPGVEHDQRAAEVVCSASASAEDDTPRGLHSSSYDATNHQHIAGDNISDGNSACSQETGRPLTTSKPTHAGKMPPSAPVHTCAKYSYLSSERITKLQHSGLINLGVVIILATNSRLILENVTKYGLRATPWMWLQRAIGISTSSNRFTLVGFEVLLMCAVAAWSIEVLGKRRLRYEQNLELSARKKEDACGSAPERQARVQQARKTTDVLMWALHCCFSLVLPLAVPVVIAYYTQPDPLPLAVLTFCSIILCMKLVSYAMVNADLRSARRAHEVRIGERGGGLTAPVNGGAGSSLDGPVDQDTSAPPLMPTLRYPENITLKNLMYFIAVPTLVYQMEYPRTKRIRKRWLLRRAIELVVFLGLMLFLVDQYVEPAILNSLVPLVDSRPLLVVERVLKLSIPCMYVWLTMFYVFFHLWLNIVAEVTQFADREFYKDWWNATTIGEYWRLWNMPVHKWMLRCVYAPVMSICGSKLVAGFTVFFVSGVLHEMAVGVPLRMTRYWAFGAMLSQLPMIFVTDALKRRFKNEVVGNIIFWLSFCIIGQPIAALLYYHDFLLEHSPQYLHGLRHR